jgi:hypothetical protein
VPRADKRADCLKTWEPQGLSRPVIGLLYLYLYLFLVDTESNPRHSGDERIKYHLSLADDVKSNIVLCHRLYGT